MGSTISDTEAITRFSDILNQVVCEGEELVIQRDGHPICRLVPVAPSRFTLSELSELLSNTTKPDPAYWDEVDALAKAQPNVPKFSWSS